MLALAVPRGRFAQRLVPSLDLIPGLEAQPVAVVALENMQELL